MTASAATISRDAKYSGRPCEVPFLCYFLWASKEKVG